jgi:coproporphyrinogen III oxidase-like Fe-S oxidoreductase
VGASGGEWRKQRGSVGRATSGRTDARVRALSKKKSNNSVKQQSDQQISIYTHTHFVLGTCLYITSIDCKHKKNIYMYRKHQEQMQTQINYPTMQRDLVHVFFKILVA